jgi:hypothetical protein
MNSIVLSIFCGIIAIFYTIFAIGALGMNLSVLIVLFYAGIAIYNGGMSIGFMDLGEN